MLAQTIPLAVRRRYSWPPVRVQSIPIERNADGTPRHHPVFASFPPFSGSIPIEFDVDYIGTRTRYDFLPYAPHRNRPEVTQLLPNFDEEYFEWIDLLTAIQNAGDHFTFLELGAGFGRWAARAALAARRHGLSFTLGLAEAEPKHLDWIPQHVSDNGIPLDQVRIHPQAVSNENGTALFQIAGSDGLDDTTAKSWYGQQLAARHDRHLTKTDRFYHGYPVLTLLSGSKAIEVQKQDICAILAQYATIDLLDMDVQGEEAKIVRAGINHLNQQVKRLHIGTHGRDIESELRKTLSRQDWQLVHDYPCFSHTRTPYGRIKFTDGVQSWVNPRL